MFDQKLTRRRVIVAGASMLAATATVGVLGASAATQTNATPPASPNASPAASPATTAEIHTEDIKFDKTTLTIAADTDVKITVTNKGVLQHDFHVDKLDVTSKLLNAGESDTVTINAKAGEYDYWCTVPGHKEAGMVGKLTVVAAGAAPAAGESSTAAEIEISTEDIKFDPKELTIEANKDVKIKVTNKGVLQHDFHVDKLDITSKLLNSGESDTVTVNAKAGEYDYWCTVPGHKEAGMVGKLTVK